MYCRECGQKLTLRFCENEGLIPYCAKCENFMFPQFPVAVSMVVTNRTQDKILLAKHVEDEDFILFAGYIKKGENAEKTGQEITKADLMDLGLYGPGSNERRAALIKKLEFPEKISTNGFLQAVNLLYSLEELAQIVETMENV